MSREKIKTNFNQLSPFFSSRLIPRKKSVTYKDEVPTHLDMTVSNLILDMTTSNLDFGMTVNIFLM